MLGRTSRRTLMARWARLTRHEYWPTPVFYAPLIPILVGLAARHRSLMAFTCVNPGFGPGGGAVGESKHHIMECFAGGGAAILGTTLVPSGPPPDQRARVALEAARARGIAFPFILKPDSAQRGHAVRLARRDADVAAYFRSMLAPAVVQPYHPGPHECGVFWMRHPSRTADTPGGSGTGPSGFIFSINRKEFPLLNPDGARTLRELILDHPRHRNQHRVFFARFSDRLDEVPPMGAPIRLAEAGNHCQGTLFRDGADLITPALTRALSRLADAFAPPAGHGRAASGAPEPFAFDFGRFDIRYESDAALRRGSGFAVVEVNGSLSESTNLYDPTFSIRRSYGILFEQWRRGYELGAVRRAQGVRPMGLLELARAARREARRRSGPSISD
ncbi:MAG: carboxylate--amine ligase [Phycisphaerae bacterium]|nr:carboxylate--amine ligase [Phycisphaerae bacterium]